MIDGAINLPQGSYFLPTLLPKGTAPDSIHNYSQIHYRKGDYNSGELGLALQIEGNDSNYFSIQGFRQSPPVMYLSSSSSDNLQNYILSYKRLSEDASISVDVMYHLEDYHLPLSSLFENDEYYRESESFHGGLGFKRKWKNLWIDFHPAFQITHTNRQNSLTTYYTVWNNFISKLYLRDHFNLFLHQQSKRILIEEDSHLSEIETHIVRPKIQYNLGGLVLEGGAALYSGLIVPEGNVSWRYKHLYLAAIRKFHFYFEPVQMENYEHKEYSLLSLNIGYISKTLKIILDLFQVTHSDFDNPGIRGEIEMDLSWLSLNQKAGIYNINSDGSMPLEIFNHISLLFSPNIWHWRTARYQPFMGVESFYLQHSGITGINPTSVPIIEETGLEPYTSHLINMELGFLVNRFKVSYRWINILNNNVQNNSRTYPIQPIQQLVVLWQFWN